MVCDTEISSETLDGTCEITRASGNLCRSLKSPFALHLISLPSRRNNWDVKQISCAICLSCGRGELEVGNWERDWLTHLVASGARSHRLVCQVKIRLLKCETCERREGLWVVELQLSGVEGTIEQEGEFFSCFLLSEQPWERWMNERPKWKKRNERVRGSEEFPSDFFVHWKRDTSFFVLVSKCCPPARNHWSLLVNPPAARVNLSAGKSLWSCIGRV